VHWLLGIKPIDNLTRYEWISFLLINILDHFCTTCLFLQILLENLFKIFLQIVKGIGIRLQEAFSGFEISLPVSNAFPLTKFKLPLNEIILLAFKRFF
jgi:hypothetical protein